MKKTTALLSLLILTNTIMAKQPDSFREAKPIVYKIAREIHPYTLYCGCPVKWLDNKKAVPDLKACGYKVRKQQGRAERIEVEHIVPAWEMAHHLPCWKKGGRKACQKNREYNRMSGDLHNLWLAVGEVNADRSNYKFSMMTGPSVSYGQCKMKVSFKDRTVEPPESVKGLVARTYMYMADKYRFNLSDKQRKLYTAWDKQYPMHSWEKKRNEMISRYN